MATYAIERVAFQIFMEGKAAAVALIVSQSIEGLLVTLQFEKYHGREEPGFGSAGLQRQGSLKTAQGFVWLIEALEFVQAKLSPRHMVIGRFLGFCAEQVAIKHSLISPGFLAYELSKVMDKECCGEKVQPQRPDLRFHQFVDATAKVNAGMLAKEPTVFVFDVGRRMLCPFVAVIIGDPHAVPSAVEPAQHIVTNGGHVAACLLCLEQCGDVASRVPVQFF